MSRQVRPAFADKDLGFFEQSPQFLVTHLDILREDEELGTLHIALSREGAQREVRLNIVGAVTTMMCWPKRDRSNIATPLGKVKLGELTIPKDMVGKKVPQLPSGTFHIVIAKSSPRAQELLTQINQAIHLLNFQGITDKIFYTYLPTCGRHC